MDEAPAGLYNRRQAWHLQTCIILDEDKNGNDAIDSNTYLAQRGRTGECQTEREPRVFWDNAACCQKERVIMIECFHIAAIAPSLVGAKRCIVIAKSCIQFDTPQVFIKSSYLADTCAAIGHKLVRMSVAKPSMT
jgi:hypothetical protein